MIAITAMPEGAFSTPANVISAGATQTTTTTAATKNSTCFRRIMPSPATSTLPVLTSVHITDSRITPITSSATAAPRMDTPSLESSSPASLSTATEIDTDVAENTTPMNAAGIGLNPNSRLTPPITATGNTTPMHAMMIAAFEYFFSNCRSQPTPPRNIRMMMPRSLNSDSESLICSTFSSAGPTRMPTRICPITSGSCTFRQISPETVVSIRMAHSEMMNVAIILVALSSRTPRVSCACVSRTPHAPRVP